MITTPEEYQDALNLMERIGGSFASNLAKAWQSADLNNRRLLDENFGWLLETYIKMVKDQQRQDA